jgi:hypothetical protein
MPQCAFGSMPADGQPQYFSIEANTVIEFLGVAELPQSAMLAFLAITLLGLPTGSLSTAEF